MAGVTIWRSNYIASDLPFSALFNVILQTLEADSLPVQRQPTLTYFFSMDPKSKYALAHETDWMELKKKYRMEVAKKKELAVVKVEPQPFVSFLLIFWHSSNAICLSVLRTASIHL